MFTNPTPNIQSNPQQTFITFQQPNQPQIFFNSHFDSGNMNKVIRNSYHHFSIWTAVDAQGTNNEGYPKSWFHFEVGGFKNRNITISVHRVHFLWPISKKSNLYRPVYKVYKQSQQSSWQRLPHPIISLKMNSEKELVLKFDFNFTQQIKSVRFAFLYPYSYQQQRKDILNLKKNYEIDQDKEIFFKQYQLIKTYQKRIVDMIVISSHEGKQGYENIKFDQYMDLGEKLVKFRDNKPIIFVSARVHPIETPSSFTMNGIIKFLLDKKDFRAHLLRRYFVFILVPMLNPDGVSNGYCRMDALNQNLNRYYKNPDPIKQPSCYAVRKLCQHYQKDKRMFMYLDLHAHPAHKGNFMFGNAIYDFIEQVQSQLFPKILSQNCINFEFENCIFSRKHMKAKDRHEDMNKEGCGRVVFYKDFGIPHAYTLQCGYHVNSFNNKIEPQKNKDNKYFVRFKTMKKGEKIYENCQRIYIEQLQQKIIQNKINNQISNIQAQIEIKTQHSLQELKLQKIQKRNNKNQQVKTLQKISQTITTCNNQNSTEQKVKLINKNNFYQGYQIFQYTQSNLDNLQDSYYQKQVVMYNTEAYENLGRNILISILDIFNKNPYSRSINLNERRKQIAEKKSKLNRFRKQQAGVRIKMKNIVQLIQEQIYSQWHKKNVFTYVQNVEISQKMQRNKSNLLRLAKSKQAKIVEKQKTVEETKNQMKNQAEQLKKTIQVQNQNFRCMLARKTANSKQQQFLIRNNFLARKIKAIRSLKKRISCKQIDKKQQSNKKSQLKTQIKRSKLKFLLPLPLSQHNIVQNGQYKNLKTQNTSQNANQLNLTKNVNIRSRTLIMYGNNTLSPITTPINSIAVVMKR